MAFICTVNLSSKMGNYLLKAGIAVTGLASLFYSGCALPTRIIENIRIKREPVVYSFVDKSYQKQVQDVDNMFKKENHPKKVDLEILVDKEFIQTYGDQNYDWWKGFHTKMKKINKRFKKGFNIDFEVDKVSYVKVPDFLPNDLNSILKWMMLHYQPDQFDAFMLLSGKKYNQAHGVSDRFGNHLIVAPENHTYFLERITQHELSHLFKAEDIKSSRTIMSNNVSRWSFKWGKNNADIIMFYSDRVWYYKDSWIHNIKKSIKELPEQERDDAKKMFCYAAGFKYHPEGMVIANRLSQKHPDNMLVKSCYKWLLENKEGK